MRPERQRDTSIKASVSRARMYMKANLDWLRGFPLGQGPGYVEWQPLLPAGGESDSPMRIDGELLRRATYALAKLRGRFPRALPRIVGDPQCWSERIGHLLDWLKAAVHKAAPLPCVAAGHSLWKKPPVLEPLVPLARRRPALVPVVHAISWLSYMAAPPAEELCLWLENVADRLEVLLHHWSGRKGVWAAVVLWELAREDSPARVEPLLRVLGTPSSHTAPSRITIEKAQEQFYALWCPEGASTSADTLPEPLDGARFAAELPVGRFVRPLPAFMQWLATERLPVRRRALELFETYFPFPLVDSWQSWWRRFQPWLREFIGKLLALPRKKRRDWVNDFNTMVVQAPRSVPIPPMLEAVRRLATPGNAAVCNALLGVASHLPAGQWCPITRAALLCYWDALATEFPKAAVQRLAQHFAVYATRYGRVKQSLTPWKQALGQKWPNREQLLARGFPEVELFRAGVGRRLWPAAYDAFGQMCREHPRVVGHFIDSNEAWGTVELWSQLVHLVKITRCAETAVAHCVALAPQVEYCWIRPEHLRNAARFCTDSDEFARMASFLENHESFKELPWLIGKLSEANWLRAVHALIQAGQTSQLCRAAIRVRCIKRLRGTVPEVDTLVDPRLPTWAERYPQPLHESLAGLASLTADAEKVAEGILRKHFPDTAALERQIAAVERKLATAGDNPHLRIRLERLRTRREKEKPLSQQRLATLERKLWCAAGRLVLAKWQEKVEREYQRVVTTVLGTPELPTWVLEPAKAVLLEAILGLEPSYRRLGLELLRRRCGSPPWNLFEHPANRRFVARLRRLGIDPAPWITPAPPQRVVGDNGRVVWLGVETDPVEILRMGQYFHTCLSPDGCNFFSAVVNAADVNKHVIYARDERQQVIGRCLVVLTATGQLLTFHPYTHDKALGFPGMVARLVGQLAAQMGTCVVQEGRVPALLAGEWYDDWPVDVCDQFPFLKEGSSFRANLKRVALSELVQVLQKAFDPLPLNELTLPLIVELEEFDIRPALIGPLLPLVEQCEVLPFTVLMRVVHLAYRGHFRHIADRIARKRIIGQLMRKKNRQGNLAHIWGQVNSLVDTMAEYNPSAALRILRATRPRGIHSDEEEVHPQRRRLLATVHEALGRRKLAELLLKTSNTE